MGSKAGCTARVAGVDARTATPPDPRPPLWRLADRPPLDPSHVVFVIYVDTAFKPMLPIHPICRQFRQVRINPDPGFMPGFTRGPAGPRVRPHRGPLNFLIADFIPR